MSLRLGSRIVALAISCTLAPLVLHEHAAAQPAFDSKEFEGKECDDYDPCTTADKFVRGMCRGEARRCDDGRRCTDDFCDRSTGRCRAGLRIDSCFIDGQCWSEDEANPNNACQVCKPTSGGTSWTERTTCDDGDACTIDDRCVAGTCTGRAYVCPSVGPCRAARCDGKGGCIEEPMPDRCTIDGTCYAIGAPHPDDPCLQCDPERSGKAWVSAEGAKCPGGVCQGGRCVATLFIEKLGSGEGRVLGPDFICRSDCLQTLTPGVRVPLTVVADAGSVFRGWSGACIGVVPCTLEAYGEMHAVAVFDRGDEVAPAAMATLRVSRQGAGTVTEAGGRIVCGDRCTASVIDGTAVDLTAAPAPGYRFVGWGGGCAGGESPCSLLVTNLTEVIARFEPVQ
jgi:hypothetical protein